MRVPGNGVSSINELQLGLEGLRHRGVRVHLSEVDVSKKLIFDEFGKFEPNKSRNLSSP